MNPEAVASQAQLNTAQVYVCTHALCQQALAILRHQDTPARDFRDALQRVGRYVLDLAFAHLPLVETIVSTPVAPAKARVLDPAVPVMIVPILRAALPVAEVAQTLLPEAHVYHIGLARNEETLLPQQYYSKLPASVPPGAKVFALDPMLATGGSAVAALDMLVAQGALPEQMAFVCLIAAPEGLACLHAAYPSVSVFTAAIDERLNEKGYIVPGLGDAGDRVFRT